MNTNKFVSRLLTLAAVVASLGIVPQAFAIDPSHLVQEGSSNCNDYGSNKDISGISDLSITVNDPSTPGTSTETIDDGNVQVTYWIDMVDGEQVLKFEDVQTISSGADEGMNLVILRGNLNKAETYMWGTDEGVTRWPPATGSSVDLTVTGEQTTIESITFCYGLGLGEEVVITMPSCPSVGEKCNGTDDMECNIDAGEMTCCCCPDLTGTDPENQCDAETGLAGCILGAPVSEGGCGVEGEFHFSSFDDITIGEGSRSGICFGTGTNQVCYR